MSKANKGKKPASKFLPGDNQDPFDLNDTTVLKEFVKMLIWHPHFGKGAFPLLLLEHYLIVHL
jgi:hypothetical protein